MPIFATFRKLSLKILSIKMKVALKDETGCGIFINLDSDISFLHFFLL